MAPQRVAAGQLGAVALMLAMAGESFGWQAFADKPRAGAAFGYLLALVAITLLKGGASRSLSLLCTWGMLVQSAGAACVIGYERLASRSIGVCDEATGKPVGLVFGAALLVVIAEAFLRGNKS